MQMINCLGGDLQSWVLPKKENEKALRITDAMRRTVLRTALQGLAYVHANGITHCGNYIFLFQIHFFLKKLTFFFLKKKTQNKTNKDIKPANIFITGNGTAVLGDFDVSRDDATRATLVSSATKAAGSFFKFFFLNFFILKIIKK